jgi:hypothetical protein
MIETIATLRSLVEQYGIRWKASTERAVVRNALQPIGFNIELSAVHGPTAHPPCPGCPACKPVVDALRTVARFVLPTQPRDSFYEVHTSQAHEFTKDRAGEPEMTAVLTILHQGDPNRPPDACEGLCRDEIIAKLKALGAREGG